MAIERTPDSARQHRRFNWHLHPDPFARFRDEMEDVFSHYFRPINGAPVQDALLVDLDAAETETRFEITLDVPGMAKKDIDIAFDNGQLTVSGKRKREQEKKGKTLHRTERSFGSFETSFSFPGEVDEDGIEAKLKDGVLTVSIPKSEDAKHKTRKIAIKTS